MTAGNSISDTGSPWEVQHTNGNSATVTELMAKPAKGRSHYLEGFILEGGAADDGFRFLRKACPSFTAANNTATISDNSVLQMGTGDFTLEFWFRWVTGTVAAVAGLLSKVSGTEGYKMEITSAGLVKATFGDSGQSVNLSSTTKVADGAWHHLAVTVDRSEKAGFIVYVDGVAEATSDDDTSDPTDITGNVTASGTNLTMTGIASVTFYVSNLGIYKGKALSATEVAESFAEGYSPYQARGYGAKFTGDETSLSVGMPMDEGTGATGYNTTGSNNATFANITWALGEGVPLERRKLHPIGPFHCVKQIQVSSVGSYQNMPSVVTFPHPIPVGEQNPVRILETDGSYTLTLFGHTRAT